MIKRMVAYGVIIVAVVTGVLWYLTREPERPELKSRAGSNGRDMRVTQTPLEIEARQAASEALRPLKTLEGHEQGIVKMAFSRDGKHLASSGGDRWVGLWDVESGKLLNKLEGHKDLVMGLAFSPDGKKLLTGSWDKTALVWDVETGAIEARFDHADRVLRCAYGPSGARVATASSNVVTMWDVGTEKSKWTGLSDGEIHSLAVSPVGELVTGDWYGTLIFWDPVTGRQIAKRSHSVPDFPESRTPILGMVFLGPERLRLCDVSGMWDWDLKDQFKPVAADVMGEQFVATADGSMCASDIGWVGDFANDNILHVQHPGSLGGSAIDAGGKYFAIGTSGVVTQEGFRSEGPGKIMIYDLKKIAEAVALQGKARAEKAETSGGAQKGGRKKDLPGGVWK